MDTKGLAVDSFSSAVASSRAGDAVAKAWPDASGGAYGGYPADGTESYSAGSEAEVGISQPRMYDSVVTPAGPGAGGALGTGPRGDASIHSHFGQYSPSNFDSGASNTCAGDANVAKAWPDAQGGGLGSVSDGDKD